MALTNHHIIDYEDSRYRWMFQKQHEEFLRQQELLEHSKSYLNNQAKQTAKPEISNQEPNKVLLLLEDV